MQHMLSDEELIRMTDEAIDIGVHAGHEASITIARIAGTLLDDRVKIVAVAVAFSYLQAKLEFLKEKDPAFALAVVGLSKLVAKRLHDASKD